MKKKRGERQAVLTDAVQQPLGFGLPPHAQEVEGQPGSDDTEADGALLWSLPDGDDDEEEAGQHEADGQQEVHLQGKDEGG